MIFTRKELNQKAIDYVNQKVKEGWKIGYKYSDNSCKDQFYRLELKVNKGDLWYEFISYGLDENRNYYFHVESFLNGKKQGFHKSLWHNAYDKFFAETKEEAEDLWLKHNL